MFTVILNPFKYTQHSVAMSVGWCHDVEITFVHLCVQTHEKNVHIVSAM